MKPFFRLLCTLAAVSLPLAALAQTPPRPMPAPRAAPATPAIAPPTDMSGPYLAARQALRADDYQGGLPHFRRALEVDGDNPQVLDWALTGLLAAGRFDEALVPARRLATTDPGNPLARIVRIAALAAARDGAGDLPGLAREFAGGTVVGPLPDRLLRGWADVASGNLPGAVEGFSTVAQMPGLAGIGQYNLALGLVVGGDLPSALAVLETLGREAGQTRRTALLQVQVLAQMGRGAEALAVLQEAFDTAADPALAVLAQRLRAGAPVGIDIARTPADGFAEVFYLLALALREEAPPRQSLLYARLAQALNPGNHDAALLAADLLEEQAQTRLAAAAYRSVPDSAPGSLEARMGLARVLHDEGDAEGAIAALRRLVADHPDIPATHIALADMLRRDSRHAEAAEAYTNALALIGPPAPRHWSLFYSRGITLERAGRFPEAEPDFRRALDLNPDQPFVLNYLGYSYLEQGSNLNEAMAMIRRAVAQEPENGYIVDSLAWGLFLLGRFDDAVDPMERAAQLKPVDPIITDHLGDVYWAVGRTREARFQWHRALSFDPEPDLANRIRGKLARGLDAVLAEEGEPPLDARRQ